MNQNHEKKIYKALIELEKTCPELFYLVKNTRIVSDKKHPSASAALTKTGFKISIREEWLEVFDQTNLSAIIEHELLHVVLDHCNDMASGVYRQPRLANVAMDCIINDIGHYFQDKSKLNDTLKKGVYLDSFNREYKTSFNSHDNTTLDIYNFLMSQKNNEKQESFDEGLTPNDSGDDEENDLGDGNESGDIGQAVEGLKKKGKKSVKDLEGEESGQADESGDEENESGDKAGKTEKISLEEILSPEELESVLKTYGKKSADIKKHFREIEKREKDKRIRKAIEAFFVSHKAEHKKSLKKLNKRFSFLPYGRQKDSKQKILLALDVSGSMLSPDDLAKLKMSVNSAVNNGFAVDLIFGDVSKLGEFKDIKPSFDFENNIHGGGGTDLKFIFDEFKIGKYDCYVIVTDGVFNWHDIPMKLKNDILFLNTTDRPIKNFKNLHI
jgi:predicted metal-dependent peptidase